MGDVGVGRCVIRMRWRMRRGECDCAAAECDKAAAGRRTPNIEDMNSTRAGGDACGHSKSVRDHQERARDDGEAVTKRRQAAALQILVPADNESNLRCVQLRKGKYRN